MRDSLSLRKTAVAPLLSASHHLVEQQHPTLNTSLRGGQQRLDPDIADPARPMPFRRRPDSSPPRCSQRRCSAPGENGCSHRQQGPAVSFRRGSTSGSALLRRGASLPEVASGSLLLFPASHKAERNVEDDRRRALRKERRNDRASSGTATELRLLVSTREVPTDAAATNIGARAPPPPHNGTAAVAARVAAGSLAAKGLPALVPEGGRSVNEFKSRHDLASDAEMSRVREAFFRFSGSKEVSRYEVVDLLDHLGYYGVMEESVEEVTACVTEFSSLDLLEVLDVVEKFAQVERELLRTAFDAHSDDEDNDGNLEQSIMAHQLPKVMLELGVTQLGKVIAEFLVEADLDHNTTLCWDNFLHFVAVYSAAEGFTREEMQSARSVFYGLSVHAPGDSSREVIRMSQLEAALVRFFGPYAAGDAKSLVDSVRTSAELPESDDESTGVAYVVRGISFHEFLVWARRLRERLLADVRSIFEEQRAGLLNNNGRIALGDVDTTTDDLFTLVRNFGITLSREAAEEFATAAHAGHSGKLDFDEFEAFLRACRENGGFSHRERAEFSSVFNRFDSDKNGEIDNLELFDMMQYLGYAKSTDEVRRILNDADASANGSMDFKEFLWWLRLHREAELKAVREAFDAHAVGGQLAAADLKAVFASMSQGHLGGMLKSVLESSGEPDMLSIEAVVDIADRCRTEAAAQKRRMAGFTKAQIDATRRHFDKHSKGGGVLDKGELLWLLLDLGIAVTDAEERRRVFELLDKARLSARDAGIPAEETGEPGSPLTTFWALVHLLQAVEQRFSGEAMSREEVVINQTRFSQTEVAEFSLLFQDWVQRTTERSALPLQRDVSSSGASRAVEGGASRRASLPLNSLAGSLSPEPLPGGGGSAAAARIQGRRAELANIFAVTPEVGTSSRSTAVLTPSVVNSRLKLQGLKLLVCSLGVELAPKQKLELDGKVQEISDGRTEDIVFADFLLLMRWMIDSNFADINGAARRIADTMRGGNNTNSAVQPVGGSRACTRRSSCP